MEVAAGSIEGRTFNDLFVEYREEPAEIQKHPVQHELIARAFELAGGITAGVLHKPLTHEMINAAGRSMLAELQENGLLQG